MVNLIQELSLLNKKDLYDLKQMIQFGTRTAEKYVVRFYNEVYGKEVAVKIRGLSNYEYDEISIEMFQEIKDPATIKYVFNPKNEEKQDTNETTGVAENKVAENTGKNEFDEELPANVSPIEITKAYMLRNVLIVHKAMKDFYDGLTIEDVKQMEGIREIARRINEKSGRTKEVQEKIQFFRDQSRKRSS